MKKLTIIFVLILFANLLASATNYYVRTDGNDSNAGTSNSASGAWRSWGKAISGPATAGDIVWFADGTWYEGELLCDNKTAGSETNRLVFKAINKWGAILCSSSNYGALSIRYSTGVTLDGFDVYYDSNEAGAHLYNCIDMSESNWITIKNCKAHNGGTSGIGCGGNSDNILVENNVVYDNCTRSNANGSGINCGHPQSRSASPSGYGVIIRGNIVYNNYCQLPFTPGGMTVPTDGNGIICDFWNDDTPYGKNGLIENNIIFNNGGAGINFVRSSNITVRNNTVWGNGWVNVCDGNFAAINVNVGSANCKVINNIVVERFANPQGYALKIEGSNCLVKNNMIVGKNSTSVVRFADYAAGCSLTSCSNSGNITSYTEAYPIFVNPGNDASTANFHLQTGSPAINVGDNSNAAVTDFDGNARPNGSTVDMGAFEYQNATTYPIITARGENQPNEGKEKAFDGNTSTKWLDMSTTSWIQIQYASAATYNKYVIVSGNDVPARDPKNWTLQGSNNGSVWTILNTQTNQTFAARNTAYTYTFTNSTAYAYYKLVITANNGDANTQLSEITFSSACTPTAITPYMAVNDSWSQTATGTAPSGAKVDLGPWPTSGGSWSWTGGGTSGTNREQTIYPTSSTSATATYTNAGGCTSTQVFTITVGSTNLLVNPGFETGTTSWPGTGCTITSMTTPVKSGSKSVKASARTANWAGTLQDVTSVTNTNGQGNYYVEAYVRSVTGSQSFSITVSTNGTNYFGTTAVSVGTTYTKISGTFNVTWTGTLTSANFYINTSSTTGDYYVDDCWMNKGTTKSALVVTEVTNVQSPRNMQMYPNPLSNQVLTIALPASANGSQNIINIFDLSGKQILSRNTTGQNVTIPPGTLKQGLYVVNVIGQKGIWNDKLIVK